MKDVPSGLAGGSAPMRTSGFGGRVFGLQLPVEVTKSAQGTLCKRHMYESSQREELAEVFLFALKLRLHSFAIDSFHFFKSCFHWSDQFKLASLRHGTPPYLWKQNLRNTSTGCEQRGSQSTTRAASRTRQAKSVQSPTKMDGPEGQAQEFGAIRCKLDP